MVALERIEDQALVRLGDLCVREAALVREVHLRRNCACIQTGGLRVEFQVDGLRRLDADHELVARNVLEDALGDILELDADLSLLLVEGCQLSVAELSKSYRG